MRIRWKPKVRGVSEFKEEVVTRSKVREACHKAAYHLAHDSDWCPLIANALEAELFPEKLPEPEFSI